MLCCPEQMTFIPEDKFLTPHLEIYVSVTSLTNKGNVHATTLGSQPRFCQV